MEQYLKTFIFMTFFMQIATSLQGVIRTANGKGISMIFTDPPSLIQQVKRNLQRKM